MMDRYAVIERGRHRTHISGPYDSHPQAEAAVQGFRHVDTEPIEYEVVKLAPVPERAG